MLWNRGMPPKTFCEPCAIMIVANTSRRTSNAKGSTRSRYFVNRSSLFVMNLDAAAAHGAQERFRGHVQLLAHPATFSNFTGGEHLHDDRGRPRGSAHH